MKRTQKLGYFFTGAVAMLLVAALIIPAYAAMTGKTIQVSSGVNLYLNDNKFIPKDVNGNQVEVFVYNGTTYLPARAISEAVGLPVQWDGATSSVYIGKHSSDTPAVMLQDLEPFIGTKYKTEASIVDNTEITRYQYIKCSDYLKINDYENLYKINGQYTSIRGTIFQPQYYKNYDRAIVLEIYGDGKLLKSVEMNAGIEPISFNVNLTGVLELLIIIQGRGDGRACISDFGLYT